MAYIYPEEPSKIAIKRGLAEGKSYTIRENTPRGQQALMSGSHTFEGPHYPKAHRYYGVAVVAKGKVISVE